ncbi:MAG: YDG domain-containing protein, partial [Bifidobacteriaceae bacterium]|nr:YDG domain-containing protein [Bifidobacteriaceae bacterium]
MKAKLFGLALAAAGLSGLTAQAAFAADGVSQANLDVVVNVTDSSASGGTTPTPSPDNSGGQDTSDTTGAQDLPYTGFDPRLAGLGLGAMAAGGLLIWGAKRKNDGKTFLPKAALVVAGAAGLVVAGSFTALAASEIGQTGEVDTNGDVVITIDKAKSLTGEAAFAIDLPQASTYFGLEGRIDVPEGLSLAVNGTPLTGDFSELMTVEDPAGTGHVAGTLTATVSPDAAVESFHLTYSLTAQDKRFELTLTPQAGDKVYDGTTAAGDIAFASTDEFVSGVQVGDDVTVQVAGELAGEFADRNAGEDITVEVDPAQFSLTGADAFRYQLVVIQPAADITAKPLGAAVEVEDKTYDGNDTAAHGQAVLVDSVVDGDQVALADGVTCEFEAEPGLEAAAAGIHDTACFAAGTGLVGDQAGNYELSGFESNDAEIFARELTVEGLQAQDRVYDGTTKVVIGGDGQLVGALDGDDVTLQGDAQGEFEVKNIGVDKPVTITGLSLDGADAANYYLVQPSSAATVTKRPVRFAGLKADKTYDGTDHGFAVGQATLDGKIDGDQVTYMLVLEGSYDSAKAGARVFTPALAHLLGLDAPNYQLDPTIDATIAKKPVRFAGLKADKTYDGTDHGFAVGQASLDGKINGDQVTYMLVLEGSY